MSGDVQPRRRKDKSRRKKEEEDAGTPPPTLVSPSSDPSAEYLTIHVHKEGGTGGHWCARIIFFSLLAILVGLIGVILIEHRGAADVDTPVAESRWATIFDGWVDDSQLSHEQAEHVTKDLENHRKKDEQEEEAREKANQPDEEEDHAEENEEDNLTGEESEEQRQDSNENEEEDEEDDDQDLDSHQEKIESDEETASMEKEKEEQSEKIEQAEFEQLKNNYIEESVEQGEIEYGEEEEDKEEEDEEEEVGEDEDDAAALEEVTENTSNEEGDFAERAEDEIINESDNELDTSIEAVDILREKQSQNNGEDLSTEFFNIPGVNEIDDNSAEPLEEVEEEEPEKILNETEIEPEVEEVPEESSSGVRAPRAADEIPTPISQASASRSKPVPKQGGARDYEHDGITNIDDAVIREELDAAQGQTAEQRVSYFTALLSRHPRSPRGKYELAKALDNLAEERKDNSYLKKAVNSYESILELGTLVPTELFRIVGERCIDRLRFSGQYSAAEPVHRSLIARFSDEPRLRNQLAVTYLMQNKLSEARKVLQEILGRWPDDGFALVHYGFILKTGDGNMIDAIMYLRAGIESGHEGTVDGRFFFHLGDALVRLGRAEEAVKIYQTGAEKGLFPSAYQRSLYNIDRLTARPWWTLEVTSYKEFFHTLENNWLVIKAEGLAVLNKNGQFKNEAENLRDKGSWQQFELFARGRKIPENCAKTPRTCALIERFPAAAGCRRGQAKFSVMYPGTHVWPHCGPTNCRLRGHLALSGTEGTYIRVGKETRTWQEGKVMVFDDSFEHEVWHNGTLTRLVLIVDVWHPELLESERRTLPAI